MAESITRKKIGCAASALHTHRHASLVSRYTTLVPPLKLCIGPYCYAGVSTSTWREHVPLCKKKERKL